MSNLSEKRAFLPNFCAIRTVFAVVVSAQLLSIVLTLASFPVARDMWHVLSLRSLYIQWVALTVAGLLCLLRKPLNRLGQGEAGVFSWLIIQLVTGLVFATYAVVIARWEVIPWRDLFQQLAISGIVGAALLRYLYEQYRQRERELAESRARFQALQARIRPHFLFNSMNTIASLTRVDADLAEEVVHDLSDLFRASLKDAADMSTLQQELELARGYLNIEAQRLGERLQVEWDLEELPLQAKMPGLLLQPLLENAVYHGIEPVLQGGVIRVTGRYRRGVINLSVLNRVPEQGQNSHREGNHLAMDNVRDRLDSAFADNAGIRVGMVDDYYQVRLFFPFVQPG